MTAASNASLSSLSANPPSPTEEVKRSSHLPPIYSENTGRVVCRLPCPVCTVVDVQKDTKDGQNAGNSTNGDKTDNRSTSSDDDRPVLNGDPRPVLIDVR